MEELERDMREKERKHEANITHLSFRITPLLRKETKSSSRLTDFKKFEEFQRLLVDNALKYYHHGYRTCAASNFLYIHAGLVDAPEPDEEVPQELLENLLYVPLEGEAPIDPENPMVEDIVPLKVVPLLLMKVQILPPSKSVFLVFLLKSIAASSMRFIEIPTCGL
ncbi:UNVERIFIED_CONTAM: hypothetical protein Sindi_2123200 [Sesamum indicum]